MIRKHSNKPEEQKKIAKEHIKSLFLQANEAFSLNPELSDRYIDLARKTAMKYKIKLSSNQKRSFCKHCYKFLRPGVNCRVRNQSGKIVYSCLSCKKFMRIPIK